MFKRISTALALSAAMATSAMAATIYDEGVSGDAGLTSNSAHVDLGVIGQGFSQVFGDLAGHSAVNVFPNVDTFDSFVFELTQDTSITASGYGGEAPFAVIFENSLDDRVNLTKTGIGSSSFDNNMTDQLIGVFSAGLYAFEITPFQNANTFDYSLNFTVAPAAVPLPAGVLLLATGLAGLGFLRRRADVPSHT